MLCYPPNENFELSRSERKEQVRTKVVMFPKYWRVSHDIEKVVSQAEKSRGEARPSVVGIWGGGEDSQAKGGTLSFSP